MSKGSSQIVHRSASTISSMRDVRRLGTRTLATLGAMIVAQMCMCAFVAFLWYGNVDIEVWNRILINAWITRAVAVTTLLLRTAVDLQAAVGSAILASLFLESKYGLRLHQTANISPMRASGTSPWSFAWLAVGNACRSGSRRHRQYGLLAMTACLLLTTSLFNFPQLCSSPISSLGLCKATFLCRKFETICRMTHNYSNIQKSFKVRYGWQAFPHFLLLANIMNRSRWPNRYSQYWLALEGASSIGHG
jgi:hypothetical protein